VYEGIDGDDYYKLEITKASGRAAYTPKSGDNYVFTIEKDGQTNISTGKVTVKSGGLELKPSNSDSAPAVTVKIESGLMTGIEGTITLDDGQEVQPPSNIIPAKTNDIFLTANNWVDPEGQSWYAQTGPLSEFTLHKPKMGEKLTFKVSGTPDKSMNFVIGLYSNTSEDKWWEYTWHGNCDEVKLSSNVPFNDEFVITVSVNTNPAHVFKLEVNNVLWWKNEKESYDSGQGKLPPGANGETVMATIKDFRISLVKIELE
jgi:hypothetical protein